MYVSVNMCLILTLETLPHKGQTKSMKMTKEPLNILTGADCPGQGKAIMPRSVVRH